MKEKMTKKHRVLELNCQRIQELLTLGAKTSVVFKRKIEIKEKFGKKRKKTNSEMSSVGPLPITPKSCGLRLPVIWEVLKLCFPDSTGLLFSFL